MNSLISPRPLKKGDKIAIIALASRLNINDIRAAISTIETQWGLEVIVGKSVNSAYFNFAGTDEIRRNDFQEMLDNQDIKAIFSARGGYGSSRILDDIDFTNFQNNPKWMVGFSDITAVHCQIQQLGFQSLHGPMPKTFHLDQTSLQTLEDLLFGKTTEYTSPANEINKNGIAHGQIIGGNLCLLAHLIGSKTDLNTDGKILFIEEIDEYLYNIDRMVVQLKRAGKLKNLAGLLVGSFTDVKENSTLFGKSPYEIITEHTADYHFPIAYGYPIGHENQNWTIPCGRMANLSIDNQGVRLVFEEIKEDFI